MYTKMNSTRQNFKLSKTSSREVNSMPNPILFHKLVLKLTKMCQSLTYIRNLFGIFLTMLGV